MSSPPPPPPQVSPDGKFYWDGERWVPMPAQAPAVAAPPAAPPAAQAVVTRGQMPAWAAIAGLVICPPLGLVMVGFTPWRVMTKVGVAVAAVVAWVIFLIAIGNH